jgi:uncharacterized sulfatase
MYPTTVGSHYMRCKAEPAAQHHHVHGVLEKPMLFAPTMSNKITTWQDPEGSLNELRNKAHWRNRRREQPFFAVFNNVVTHDQIRAAEGVYRENTARLTAARRHDPNKMHIPPFLPDCPETRRNWARRAIMSRRWIIGLPTIQPNWKGQASG